MKQTTEVKKADFLGSWERQDQMPHKELPEFAFIGRSNVGKSSLINMLCGRKNLAHTSSTPGKTQTLNLFKIDSRLQFCDLPGYGYAKVSKKQRAVFSKMIGHYLQGRPNLMCLFILVDLRIEPQELDIEFINNTGEAGIPLALIGTKADKLNQTELAESVKTYENKLLEYWEELPPFFISSSEKGTGKSEIIAFIHKYSGSNTK
jgi:GTP-binding protein